MTLPKLPKTHKQTEAKSSLKFRKWLMDNPQITCAYEMKDTRGKQTFRLSEWKAHQRDFAEAIRYSKKGVLIRTEGVVGLPDYIYMREQPTYVVIKFPQGFAVIDSQTLILEEAKSINWHKACELAHIVI